MKFLSRCLHDLANLFFPHLCVGCGTVVSVPSEYLCIHCRINWPVTGFADRENNPVSQIFRERSAVRHAMAYCYFTKRSGVQELLHLLKYRDDKTVAVYIGNMMTEALINSSLYTDIDMIIPVPMHPKKEKIRGYNQTKLIADSIAKNWNGLEVCTAITKTSQTESQTKKSRWERWRNMQDRFVLQHPEKVANRNILLLDDVITTGATLEACTQVLLQGKPASVNIAGFAWAATRI